MFYEWLSSHDVLSDYDKISRFSAVNRIFAADIPRNRFIAKNRRAQPCAF